MNYIKHLTAYFEKASEDHALNPTHISLYMALFQFWNRSRFRSPMSITREEVMHISKIGSKATYHKCMRELHDKGYIVYKPSYNPFHGSKVQMVILSQDLKPDKKNGKAGLLNEQVVEQEENKFHIGISTTAEQALVSSINNTNCTNNENLLNLDEIKKASSNNEFQNQSEPFVKTAIPPDQESVKQFFKTQNSTAVEAEKFYNHFESNGWLVGGKAKMKDWKAAARNWILNSKKFNPNKTDLKPKHLTTSAQKNYGEPL